MAKKRDGIAVMQRTAQVAGNLHEQDRDATSRSARTREKRIDVPLSRIQGRDQDTRPLNPDHVADLMESIGILGLIEPLVVDQHNKLLAGGHRLEAIRELKQKDGSAYETHFPDNAIPVRVIPFDAQEDTERALQIEVAENEKRRDYTPAEVRAIAEHLKSAGYEAVKGRPKKGHKALMPAVSVVVGKNIRTIQRYMNGEQNSKSTTDVVLSLNKALKSLEKWQKTKPKTRAEKELAERLPEFLDLLKKAAAN